MVRRRKRRKAKEPAKTQLLIDVHVYDGQPMFLRTPMGTATLEDGTEVEVSTNVNGGCVIIRHPEVTMTVPTRGFVEMVLNYLAAQKQ